MTPDDRLAAFVVLVLMAAFVIGMTIAAHQIIGVIRDRPIVTGSHKSTHPCERLTIVRSPNPRGRPRRHGPQ